MSLQRAYVNCERCYALAREPGSVAEIVILKRGEIYVSRNEAMKALEDEQRACREVVRDLGVTLEKTYSAIATEALNVCRTCDYSTPSIVNLLNEKGWE